MKTRISHTSRQEYSEHERSFEYYNELWSRKADQHNQVHPYVSVVLNLAQKYKMSPRNVIDIGAGFGNPAAEFLKLFTPEMYDLYEFSSAADEISKTLTSKVPNNTRIHIYKYNFQNLTRRLLAKYNVLVALEILEHINNDLEFLDKLKQKTCILFSLPISISRFHVRAFPTKRQIYQRYSHLINIIEINPILDHTNTIKWWGGIGVIK